MNTQGISLIMLAALVLALFLISCAPRIPHTVEARTECITCHGNDGVKPYPAWHAKKGYKNDECSSCHSPKSNERNMAGTATK